tara:strand:- start:128 stop:445 length:318 start_codon:yes stop_codon:yes gene_type:complete
MDIGLGFAILIWLTIIFQWIFIAWLVIGRSTERREAQERNAQLLETLASTAGNTAGRNYPQTLTIEHPETGETLTSIHVGNGHYSSPVTPQDGMQNMTEEVEGTS